MDRRSLMWLVFMVLVVTTAVYLVVMEDELVSLPPRILGSAGALAEGSSGATGEAMKPTKLCILKTDLVLIYIPAGGSAVVQSILLRFGYLNDLFVTLPIRPGNPSIPQDLRSGDIRRQDVLQPPAVFSRELTRNILAHQVRYNRDALHKIVKRNAQYVTILRNPLDRFETDFVSSHLEMQFDVEQRPNPPPLQRYLSAPEFWEKRRMRVNYRCTTNCMAEALGIPVRGRGMGVFPGLGPGGKAVIDYIDALESEFALVLIYERLNQSLVLLKRHMCWTIRDILYDVGFKEPPANQRDVRDESKKLQFRRVNGADHLLYYHFYDIFRAKVAAEGEDFKREVRHYERVLDKVSRYCSSAIDDWKVANQTVVWESEWDEEFVVTRRMCWEIRRKRDDWDKLFRERYSSRSQGNN
ncbi:galactosylceramide sulfotransferase-like [Branchiostoma lanceolatum]|uniref:galactosylceramide sulfotransferase-like n=1 Tax=Branchiostoma lanceolatum TaxID=7740 RepID=UPI003452C7CC